MDESPLAGQLALVYGHSTGSNHKEKRETELNACTKDDLTIPPISYVNVNKQLGSAAATEHGISLWDRRNHTQTDKERTHDRHSWHINGNMQHRETQANEDHTSKYTLSLSPASSKPRNPSEHTTPK